MYVTVGAGEPFHVPAVTVVELPTRAVPDMTGAVALVGTCVMTAEVADHDPTEPAELVAVTFTVRYLPTSRAVKR